MLLCDVVRDAGSSIQHHVHLQQQKTVQEVRVPPGARHPISHGPNLHLRLPPFFFFVCFYLVSLIYFVAVSHKPNLDSGGFHQK